MKKTHILGALAALLALTGGQLTKGAELKPLAEADMVSAVAADTVAGAATCCMRSAAADTIVADGAEFEARRHETYIRLYDNMGIIASHRNNADVRGYYARQLKSLFGGGSDSVTVKSRGSYGLNASVMALDDFIDFILSHTDEVPVVISFEMPSFAEGGMAVKCGRSLSAAELMVPENDRINPVSVDPSRMLATEWEPIVGGRLVPQPCVSSLTVMMVPSEQQPQSERVIEFNGTPTVVFGLPR